MARDGGNLEFDSFLKKLEKGANERAMGHAVDPNSREGRPVDIRGGGLVHLAVLVELA